MLKDFALEIGAPLLLLSPLVLLTVAGLILMIQPATGSTRKGALSPGAIALFSLLFASFAFQLIRGNYDEGLFGFSDFIKVDHRAGVVSLILLLSAVASVVMAMPFGGTTAKHCNSDFYALLLFSVCGAWLMLVSNELVTLFVGMELTSLALYALCAAARERTLSLEAGFKYLIAGSFSSAFFLLGMAFYFGATGELQLGVWDLRKLGEHPGDLSLYFAGLGFMILAMAFKVGLAPFHFWSPDVYEGASTPVTAYMATAIKCVSLVVLIRLFEPVLLITTSHTSVWVGLIWVFACLSMLVGNLLALRQTGLKRMLACSSIAHAGYIMLAFPALGAVSGFSAFAYYLIIYSLLSLGAFGVVSILEHRLSLGADNRIEVRISDLKGLYQNYPGLSLLLSIFVLGLAGLPPVFGGLLAKILVFASGMSSGMVGAVLIAAISATVSIAYYLKVLASVYFASSLESKLHSGELAAQPLSLTCLYAILVFCAVAVIFLGIFPQFILITV
jgi:NADH-quinone oxidoreductase subunit N